MEHMALSPAPSPLRDPGGETGLPGRIPEPLGELNSLSVWSMIEENNEVPLCESAVLRAGRGISGNPSMVMVLAIDDRALSNG